MSVSPAPAQKPLPPSTPQQRKQKQHQHSQLNEATTAASDLQSTHSRSQSTKIGAAGRTVPSRHQLTLLVMLLTLAYRWAVSLDSHSGQSKPPLFGDYEAQRHWMEITYHLNVHDWYVNGSHNDLAYWGLDYPPLTAYHSYVMGFVADRFVDPAFVRLFESRGIETAAHKLFMRATVLIADVAIFYPSVLLLVGVLVSATAPLKHSSSSSSSSSSSNNNYNYARTLLLVLLNPTLVLIDHGHFQYNCVSLGLMQLAVYFVMRAGGHERDRRLAWLLAGSCLFTLALNYKQMELYHALPFFFYLLGVCVRAPTRLSCLSRLLLIGLVVLATFGLVWLPFVAHGGEMVAQLLRRLFPFSRGLFEDKVANVWCALSVVLKLRARFDVAFLSTLSLLVTAALNLPSGVDLLRRPTRARFLLALTNSALVFYLFSFQVHEKSILLATMYMRL